MEIISETYRKRLQLLAGIEPLDEAINLSRNDLLSAYEKSGTRIHGFDISAINQAIFEGRAIGILYKSNEMPVQKYRVILPVTLGIYRTKSGVALKLSAYHLGGQSERAAGKTGTRSEEVQNVWRLFDLDGKKFRGMWYTEFFFYENPPGYKRGDPRFSSIQAAYNPRLAKIEREKREKTGKELGKPIDLTNAKNTETATEPKTPETANDKGIISTNKEKPLQEKERNALYVKKPWLKYLRKGFLEGGEI